MSEAIVATADVQDVVLPFDNVLLSYPVTYPIIFNVLLIGIERFDAIGRSRLATALAIMLISDPITLAVTGNTTLYNLPYTSLTCNPNISLPENGGSTFPVALNLTVEVRHTLRRPTARFPTQTPPPSER